jgi:catechol 2,3-dioxygenase-like lactoylglutathione lyase family enzyme
VLIRRSHEESRTPAADVLVLPHAHLNPFRSRLPVRPGNSDLCFVWPGSVEGAIAHLAAHGVEIETGPVPRLGAQGKGMSVYLRDPDGSLLEFITY